MGKPYKVLVIAGGGVFGAIPATFLAGRFKDKNLLGKFDCFAGTSIGGILAMLYASGETAQEVLHEFKSFAPKAFPRMPWWWRYNPLRTKYKADGIEEALRASLSMPLKDLKAPVIVPTIDFQYGKPKVFDTLIMDEDGDVPAWEVGRATSSAPTYFPPFQKYIDGGLMSNLPIMETATAIKHKLGIPFEDMHFFVLGTGAMPRGRRTMRKVRHWSRLHWVMPLLNSMVRTNEMRTTFLSNQMPFGRLSIFNPVTLEREWEMDRADLVPVLESMAAQFDHTFKVAYDKFNK